MTITGSGDPAEVAVGYASSSLFGLLGVEMDRGRGFAEDEVGALAPRLAVVSYELWRDRYGEDPGLLGPSIRLDDHAFEVIGVLPASFALRALAPFGPMSRRHALWLPIGTDGSSLDAGNHSYEAMGRLAPGVTLERAGSEAATIIWAGAEPGTRGTRVVLRKDEEIGDATGPLLLLSAAVGLLVLIACANVASLLLGDTLQRARDLATKAALGASRVRLLRGLAAEGLLLGLAGAVLGLVLAHWGTRLLLGLAPAEMALPPEIPLDPLVLAFAGALAVGSGLASATLPGGS